MMLGLLASVAEKIDLQFVEMGRKGIAEIEIRIRFKMC